MRILGRELAIEVHLRLVVGEVEAVGGWILVPGGLGIPGKGKVAGGGGVNGVVVVAVRHYGNNG